MPNDRVSCLPLPGLLPWLCDDGSMYMYAPIEVMDADNLDSDRISIAQTQSPSSIGSRRCAICRAPIGDRSFPHYFFRILAVTVVINQPR